MRAGKYRQQIYPSPAGEAGKNKKSGINMTPEKKTTPKFNRFAKGSGSFECEDCGKLTRETGAGESQFRLCRDCIEKAERENARADSDDFQEE
jgi:hypothetical protein